MKIRMSAPDLSPDDVASVMEVLRSPSLSMGPQVERFEEEWKSRLGVGHAVAVSSGTAGLHLTMVVAGASDGDLVITSPFSFVASANAALYERAIPVFVDVDPRTHNIDAKAVSEALRDLDEGGARADRWLPPALRSKGAARPARVVLPVHVFGQPAEMPAILGAAARHGATVIEDACEAPGAEYEGRPAGTFGAAAVFGFYPNKPITTGEGGLVVTDDGGWAAILRSLRNQGRDEDSTWMRHVRLGYNYRLDEMSAALGVAQVRRLDSLLGRRARVAAAYDERLRDVNGLERPYLAPTTTRMSWFVYVVRLAADIDRDRVMEELARAGVPTRPYFSPIHLQPFYRERFGYRGGEYPVTEATAASTLALPFHGSLTGEEIDQVCEALARAVSAGA